jgi:pimeloyl-ACP methyl ester carboxylesterase
MRSGGSSWGSNTGRFTLGCSRNWSLAVTRDNHGDTAARASIQSHGGVPRPNIAYTTQTFVDFIAEFLREQGIHHFYLAGESMGGLIAALYAAESAAPDATISKVDKLVLSDAAIFDPKGPTTWPPTDQKPRGFVPSSVEEYRQGLADGLFFNPAFATVCFRQSCVNQKQ